jgi:hypothetical protein
MLKAFFFKEQTSSALVDSAPGHQETKNALLYAGHFLLVWRMSLLD